MTGDGLTNLTSDDVLQEIFRKILITIEGARIKNKNVTPETLCEELAIPVAKTKYLIGIVVRRGEAKLNGTLRLTRKGRKTIKVGLIGGVFDIIHPGHIATLEEAKQRCDLLVVVIAKDSTVKRNKGKNSINNEEERKRVVEAIKPVDAAILGDDSDHTKPLIHVDPDLIFLGYDQKLPEKVSESKLNYDVERIKIHIEGANTSKMIEKIRESTQPEGSVR
ncbi:MAG: adenylyltransferase/cytidyltransferase family protein [Nitrososphaeria archaeon]|nr:adenylyltransferase/cytidyltransferase family protein [Nitrososphaeria archaeon]